MERRQRPQACQYQEEDTGIAFRKILESEEAGIVIYRYVPDTNGAGNGESYIIKSTKKQQVTSEDFTIAFEQNKIICPRCVKILEHSESLVKYIPLIESQDIVSICDHCLRKGEKNRPRSSCWCRQIVNKFLIGRQLEEVKSRKHRIKQWLLEAHQVLQNDSSHIDKIVTGLIRNKAMDKDVVQVDHVPFKQVESADSPPTGIKDRLLPFPEIVYTDLHGLMRCDPNFDNAIPKVNPVDDIKFKQLESIDGPSIGLKVRRPPFLESINTDSHELMRRDPSLDNSLQKHFEKHLLNSFYKEKRPGEPTLTKLSEEKQSGKKERKYTSTCKVASFLDVPEENFNPNMFNRAKSQRGKIKETQKRPSIQREKNGRESRGLQGTSNRHLPKGSLKPLSEHDHTKVFSFLFPQELIQTSSSFRFASSTELLKNMQDMFKVQDEKEKLAKEDDFKRKRERVYAREKNKTIDVAQLITGENDKKSNTLTKDTDSSSGFGKQIKVERTSIDKETSRNKKLYTAAETNENKYHEKKEQKEQARKEIELKDRVKKEQERKSEKDQQARKGVILKDTASKGAVIPSLSVLKDGTQKWEKPGDEKFKLEKAKGDNLKHVTGREKKQKYLVGKEVKSKKKLQTLNIREQLDTSQPTLKDNSVTLKGGTSKQEKPGNEKLKPEKAKEEKLKDVTGKEDTKGKKIYTDLKYTLVTSQPTLTLKDIPETKAFKVVIPERPKPIMIVKKLQQPITKEEIKLTKTREELIMKLIRLKQTQYKSGEISKPRSRYANNKSEEIKIESMEAYALYNESDIMLELAELEEISKHATPGKREEAIIIGTQIVKENLLK